MIPVQTIVDRISSALDAEGFSRYNFDDDFAPAINSAQEWLVSAYSRVFNENKFSEENLKELIRIRMWVTSTYSRVAINETELGASVWSIVAVYPELTSRVGYTGTLATSDDVEKSAYCPSASYLKSYKSAKRTTLEKVNVNRNNPFAQGNEIDTCADTKEYSYLLFVDYSGAYTPSPLWELEILPNVGLEPVAIAYLEQPTEITLITDSLQFPPSITNLVVDKSLEFISRKQGDNTTLKDVSSEDVSVLMQLTT